MNVVSKVTLAAASNMISKMGGVASHFCDGKLTNVLMMMLRSCRDEKS